MPHLRGLTLVSRWGDGLRLRDHDRLMTINQATGFRRILLAIDDSPQSVAATSSLEAMASGGGAEVLVLHIWDANAAVRYGESREAADQLVAEVAALLYAFGIAAVMSARVSRGDIVE